MSFPHEFVVQQFEKLFIAINMDGPTFIQQFDKLFVAINMDDSTFIQFYDNDQHHHIMSKLFCM